MCGNMLKLNEDKTELIIFAPKYRFKDLSNCHLSIGGNIISSAECVNNLGVYFDETLSMTKQVSAVSKSCFHQIRNIGRIRQYITEDGVCIDTDKILAASEENVALGLYGRISFALLSFSQPCFALVVTFE
jgi:hypothetical protein